MNLLFDLPAAQRGAFTPADGEEIKYCSPCDIDREGKLTHDRYLVVTNKRLLVIAGPRLTSANPPTIPSH